MVASSRPFGRLRAPDQERIRSIAEFERMNLTQSELADIEELCKNLLAAIDVVDDYDSGTSTSLPTDSTSSELVRDLGHSPSRVEDPINAFITRCNVKGADSGKMHGKRVGIKDNISVRGVRMTNASRLTEFYIANEDATIVKRLLDAGASIVGKLNLDDMSFSGTTETSIFGAVSNPVNPAYHPGGSSGGSGAAVASGLVDIAIGVDQGGSARLPASCCGVVSIKATQGLVPTFGLAYMDHTLDSICPIAKNVHDTALTLEVIAGPDRDDPQWHAPTSNLANVQLDYANQLKNSKPIAREGLKVGIIEESLSWKGADSEVLDSFLRSADLIKKLGATVSRTSIPMFSDAVPIWLAILVHSVSAMFDSSGEGYWHRGRHNPHWNDFIGRAKRTKADYLPPLLKGSLIVGRYLREDYFSVYHSKAQNLRNALTDAVDEALGKFDVLITPTMVVKPQKLRAKVSFKEIIDSEDLVLNNTVPFNLSGHPALSLPCGMTAGLPVGLQLISRYFAESQLFKLARDFEENFDWKTL